eukprot:UN28561
MGESCGVHNTHHCTTPCDLGYHLEGTFCNLNHCTCINGTGTSGIDCLSHFDRDCKECNQGYELQGIETRNTCEEIKCNVIGGFSEGIEPDFTDGDQCHPNTVLSVISDTSCEIRCAKGFTGNPGFGIYNCGPNGGDPTASLTCYVKRCTCINGQGTTGMNCEHHNSARCSICNKGFHKRDEPGRCYQNECTCVNGTGTVGASCALHNTAHCKSCNAGYHKHIDGTSCDENACICENGQGSTHTDCLRHESEHCQNCLPGYHKSGGICFENRCSCSNGVGTLGQLCETDGTPSCASCDFGYHKGY